MNSRDIQLFSTGATYELQPTVTRLSGTLGDTTLTGVALPQRRPMTEIAAEVLRLYPGLKIADVIGESRPQRIVRARHHIWHAIKTERPDLSNSEIGRKFKRDHATILAGIKRHEQRLEREAKEMVS